MPAIRILLLGLAALPAVAASSGRSAPLVFVRNYGQARPEARFLAKTPRFNAYFERRETVLEMRGAALRIGFIDAEAAEPEAEASETGEANFLIGPEEKWVTGVPLLEGVAYREIYPGIDAFYRSSGPNLKSEYVVRPGQDPARIRLRYAGANRLEVEPDGSLTIRVGRHTLRESPPVIYQEQDGARVPVDGSFQVNGDIVSFAVGSYDRTLPLTIDPVLYYLTLFGGSGADAALAMAVDSAGAAYIAGFTSSYDLPTANPEQTANLGGNEVFVAKLSPQGNSVLYCTYIGGRADDRAYGIAVDSAGAAYIVGSTTSYNFPLKAPVQAILSGGRDAFALKLNASGNALVYSTYLGGSGAETAYAVAVDASGNAYVAGDTTSLNFPAAAFQKASRGIPDGFVAKLSADGARLVYSTYLGGNSEDHITAIAVDSAGSAVVTGSTYSADFPVASAYQPALAGGQDVFVSKFAVSGASLVFSTYLGGSAGMLGATESGRGVAVDSSGNIYVTGETSSVNFPIRGAAQSANAGWQDGFASKFGPTGALIYSTYMGGVNIDLPNAIAVDRNGYAYVAGQTTSANLASVLLTQNAPTGVFDAFVVKLAPAGDSVAAVGYFGGIGADNATAVAVDASSTVYFAGWTQSPNFTAVNGIQTINGGNYSAFVGKLSFTATATVSVAISPTSAMLSASQTKQFTATVANTSNTAVTWSISPAGAGSISTSGLYTAPSSITAQQTVTVTARSVADTTKSASATVTLTPPVSVSVSPSTASLCPSSTQTFTATVSNSSNTAVTWSLSPQTGSITSSGVYSAPATVTTASTVTVTATSAADTRQFARATVTLGSCASPASTTIWPDTAIPASPLLVSSPVTVGVKFRSDAAGTVTAIRFYKGAGNIGTHVGLLYSSSGALLAQTSFTSETASGWQTATFSAPVAIAANTTYVAALFTTGGFAANWSYFTSAAVDSPPLHALRSGADGLNGLYAYDASPKFPSQSYGDANYWVDVAFTAGQSSPPPAAGATQMWTNTATPAIAAVAGQPPVTVGVKFRSDAAGPITGIRFYKGAGNSGTHIGLLYSASGALLAKATFSAETASGWQQVNFAAPVQIAANTTYIAALYSTSGFALNLSYFTAAGVDAAPLHALRSGADGPNGLYAYGQDPQFPSLSSSDANYWVDVVYAGGASTPAPPPSNGASSIWTDSAAPGVAVTGGGSSVTVGVKFRSDTNGSITGIRFYKGAGNNGAHTGLLYSASGALLAQATFSGETASGWQSVTFSTPVPIAAGKTYVAALYTSTGFALNLNYFKTGADAAPLHALQSGVDGPNGLYAYGGAAQFPTQSYADSNYWVDVLFN